MEIIEIKEKQKREGNIEMKKRKKVKLKMEGRNENKGITLIALVITIIVLLILAGVSIATLTGDNGILTKATNSSVQNAHAQVYEALQLESEHYMILKNTGETKEELIKYLQNYGFINSDYTVNVQTLLGKKLQTGNGTGTTDVYKLEEIVKEASLLQKIASVQYLKIAETTNALNKKYSVVYYNAEGERTELGILKDITPEISNEITFNIESRILGTLSGTYHALKGMTWGEFIETEYNTFGLKLDTFPYSDGGHAMKVDEGGRLFYRDDYGVNDYVNSTSKIINGETYVLRGWSE